MELTTYGLSCALALAAVLCAAYLYGRKRTDYGVFIRMAAMAVPLTWLCSRLVFMAANLIENEFSILAYTFAFQDGGFSLMGAYAGLLLAALIAGKLTRTSVGQLLDALAVGMPLGLVIERLAERGTGLGEGAEAGEGWPAWLAIETDYGTLITVFMFEAAAALLIFAIVLLWQRSARGRKPGDVMCMFSLLFGCTQVLLESFRSDGHMEIHMGVHVQQVIAAVMILAVIAVWSRRAVVAKALPLFWPIVNGVAAVALVALAVVAEFGVDRWDSKLAAYGLMIACLIGLLVLAAFNRRASVRKA